MRAGEKERGGAGWVLEEGAMDGAGAGAGGGTCGAAGAGRGRVGAAGPGWRRVGAAGAFPAGLLAAASASAVARGMIRLVSIQAGASAPAKAQAEIR